MPPNCVQMLAVVTERIQWQTMLKLFTETSHIDALLPRPSLTQTHIVLSCFFSVRFFIPTVSSLAGRNGGSVFVCPRVDSVFRSGSRKPCHLSQHTDVALTCR